MAKLKIKLIRSLNSANKRQQATVQALGLRKIGQTVEHQDNAAIRGMVKKVAHLLNCEEA